jgi:metal-sulfur cluster biosynthetic enzyme
MKRMSRRAESMSRLKRNKRIRDGKRKKMGVKKVRTGMTKIKSKRANVVPPKKTTLKMRELKEKRIDRFYHELKKIIDPHTGMNIIDMGMVKNVVVSGDSVALDFTPTSPFCPIVHYFTKTIEAAALKVGFSECKVSMKF